MYLKLVEKARLGKHSPEEYLLTDAAILRLYESEQKRTGQIDFDKLLNLFVELLDSDVNVRNAFHERHQYIIVDEFQDNSEVQSDLLLKIVTNGRVTVVGDDDQCIYQFRGACPGNFDAFDRHYSSLHADSPITSCRPEKIRLEDNYRSTANILAVGQTFLEQMSFERGEKKLSPSREAGANAELWRCKDTHQQAIRIAQAVRKQHDEAGIPWAEIACLFRCFRLGKNGILHSALQQEFAKRKIPFRVFGGFSFLNSEVIRDILAYLTLSLTGSQDRVDDDALARVLNKPPRKLPKEALDVIKAKRASMESQKSTKAKRATTESAKSTTVGLEEAANALLSDKEVLSNARAEGLKKFFDLLLKLRVSAINTPLPELILHVWEETGLAEWHEKKAIKKSKSEVSADDESEPEDDHSEGEENNEEHTHESNGNVTTQEEKEKPEYRPRKVLTLVALAAAHVDEYRERDMKAGDEFKGRIEPLFQLAKKCLMENAEQSPWLPQVYLPTHLLDNLHLPGGRGLPVVSSFLADLALQMNTPEDGKDRKEDDKVTISTIHRAKGLEWKEVYIPFFNEEFMPTSFREDNRKNIPSRHQEGCALRAEVVTVVTGQLPPYSKARRCSCEVHYARQEARRWGMSPRERHYDEECRLAHVAATRAKDRLVFLSLENDKPSSFERCLECLPLTVVQTE